MKRKIIFGILAILVVIQFFQIDKNPLPVNPILDFQAIANPPKDVLLCLKQACYDCHSNETTYPWYASIQPLGWWLRGHTRGAKMHFNFSEFGNIPGDERSHALKECVEEIEGGDMPMKSYTWLHPEAKLSDADKQKVLDWLRNPVPANMSMSISN